MRWWALFVMALVLFVPATASALRTDVECQADGNTACWTNDYNSRSNTNLVAYYNIPATTTAILGILPYFTTPVALREAIWSAIEEACGGGGGACAGTGVSDLANPADMLSLPDLDDRFYTPVSTEVWLTRAEADAAIGAKWAHALWLEVESKVPWALSSFSTAELELLFDPESLCVDTNADPAWDKDHATEACMLPITVDHSPKRVYDVAIALVGGAPYTGTQREAFDVIELDFSSLLRHYTAADPTHASTLEHTDTEKISRRGCHSSDRTLVALMRSLNIPGGVLHGWFRGLAHSSAQFPSIDGFMRHGDDVYSIKIPQMYMLQSWSWAQANLTEDDVSNKEKNYRWDTMLRVWHEMTLGRYDAQYCADGFQAWEDVLTNEGFVDLPQDQSWLDAMEPKFAARTDCTPP